MIIFKSLKSCFPLKSYTVAFLLNSSKYRKSFLDRKEKCLSSSAFFFCLCFLAFFQPLANGFCHVIGDNGNGF